MSLVQQLIAAIRSAKGIVDQAQATATTARNHGDEAILLMQQATDGTSSPLPSKAVVLLQQAQERLNEATAEMSAGTRALEEYIADALGGEAVKLNDGEIGLSNAGQRSGAGQLDVPETVRRLADQLPVWRKFKKARALAYSDEDGIEVEFVSFEDLSAAEGLKPRFAARVVVTDHAEGHLAARMRQPNGPTNVTMVINKPPCGGPEGCDSTLPAVIPRDAIVTVYVRDADGVRSWAKYRGTGEGIL